MNKATTMIVLGGLASVFTLFGGCNLTGRRAKISVIPAPPVEAPEGYRWELNEVYSDEFNGSGLDHEKWHDTYPGWKGREPGKFVPSSVSVSDGFLKIKCTVLDPPQGKSGQWNIACGAVQSKASDALYGYYETRMKASGLTTSSTFWLINKRKNNKRPFKRTELDVMECIGNAQRWPGFKDHMHSNTHLEVFPKDPGAEPAGAKKGNTKKMEKPVNEDFHTYGCWWIDAKTMKFYLDGKYVYSIEPSTELDKTPFDQPMVLNMVCEIYTWEFLPWTENLLNDSVNTTLYDYVRAYKLVKIDDSK